MNHKGANQQKGNLARRNALGRGLSALMSSTALAVDVTKFEPTSSAAPVDQSGLAAAPHAARLETGSDAVVPIRRGLDAALPEVAPERSYKRFEAPEALPTEDDHVGEQGLTYLALERVTPSATQPRTHFSTAEINTLASSIRESGLLQPILVRRRQGETGPLARYEIVAGERRYRAAKIAGLQRIPAIVRQIDDRTALQLGIIENVQRENLNAIEEARAYDRLITEFGETQSTVADSVGKDRASVANALRLLKLPESVQQLLISGKISAGHARTLLALSSEQEQLSLAKRIVNEGLSVRAVEQLVASAHPEKTREKRSSTRNIAARPSNQDSLEERFRRALGTKVSLVLGSAGKGELRISFFSEAELQSLLDRFEA